jgi:hypothetical protein
MHQTEARTVSSPSPRKWRTQAMVAGVLLVGASAAAADTLGRLQGLLDATPEGGWVKASTTTFSSAWPTGSAAVNIPSYQNPSSVVIAWSSFAWDSKRGDLLLFGGGHANYAGNEMYVWDGASGAWGRGSLPSRLDGANFVVDNAAPQSAHTYDNNVYLRVNDRFLTLGGAAFQSGGNFESNIGGVPQRAGPWVWDPSRADPDRAGGTDGSGYAPGSLGGQMWQNRQGRWTGTEGPSYINGTTAYRTENGRDVVYLTADSNASGFPSLYRYELGDLTDPAALDKWSTVGVSRQTFSYKGAGTLDSAHGLYIRSAGNSAGADLAVWDIDRAVASNTALSDTAVSLVKPDGTAFEISGEFGLEYDAMTGNMLLWDGKSDGLVWSTKAEFDVNGGLKSTWTVVPLLSTTADQPDGDFVTGVLGKWKYVTELGAFVALDEFDGATGDAAVWLYKPYGSTPPIPEPGTAVLALGGLAALMVRLRRTRGKRPA